MLKFLYFLIYPTIKKTDDKYRNHLIMSANSFIIPNRMGKVIKYTWIFFVFISVNLYLGIHLFRQFNEFKLKNGPISIKTVSEKPFGFVAALDIDKDGYDKVILTRRYLPDKHEYLVFDPGEKNNIQDTSASLKVPDSYEFLDASYNKESNNYIFRFLECVENRIVLRETDNRGNKDRILMELEYPKFQSLPYQWNWFFHPVFLDADEDGEKEIIVTLRAFYERYPRGATCFDPKSRKKLWTYFAGTQFNSMIIKDLTGDGKNEIVISTTAVNNGAELNGTSDAFSYVIALDCKGKKIWENKTGDWYTFAYSVVSDLDNDGICEIVTGVECHRAHAKEKGKLYIFNGETGVVKASFSCPDASFLRPVVISCNDGNSWIYVSDSRGRLRVFDGKLNCLKTVTEDSSLAVLYVLTGINGRQYIFASTPNQLMTYDRDLERRIFEYTFENPLKDNAVLELFSTFIPIHTKKGEKALILTDKLYQVGESKKRFPDILKNGIATGLWFTAFILFLFNWFLFYFLSRFKKYGFLPTGRKYAQEKLQFLEIIQEIAHQLKNPISTVLWAAEKLKRSTETNGIKKDATGETYSQLADFLMDDVKTLRRHTNNILRLMQIQEPRFGETKLKPLLQGLVDQFRSGAEGKIEIRLEMPGDFTFFIDGELIKEALAYLLDNALEGVPGGGTITLSIVPLESFLKRRVSEVSITVEDTGSGIGKKDLSRVFLPSLTKENKAKEIGLFIFKRIIKAHGGRIKVSSRKGVGTKVTVTLSSPGRRGSNR